MKATELRIGNVVKTKDKECIIMGLFIDKVMLDDGNDEEKEPLIKDYDKIEPIKIDKNWFNLFNIQPTLGLCDNPEFINTDVKKANMRVFGCVNARYTNDSCIVMMGSDMHIKTIKYVHELQNIFMELTGVELNINNCDSN